MARRPKTTATFPHPRCFFRTLTGNKQFLNAPLTVVFFPLSALCGDQARQSCWEVQQHRQGSFSDSSLLQRPACLVLPTHSFLDLDQAGRSAASYCLLLRPNPSHTRKDTYPKSGRHLSRERTRPSETTSRDETTTAAGREPSPSLA